MTKIAITGATGFIGRHLLDALAPRARIRALTRRPQPTRAGVEWVEGSLENEAALASLLAGADVVIHCAGLVKARRRAEFFDCNVVGTERLLAAVADRAPAARLIHISSLAARAPHLSAYAASKRAAEDLVRERPRGEQGRWLIVRPPGVYGPGDREILRLIRAAARGILPVPGRLGNRVSLIFAPDLARLVADLVHAGAPWGRILEVDDGRAGGYDYRDLAKVLSEVLARPVRPFVLPSPALYGLAATAELLGLLAPRPAMLSRDKVRELLHPDWVAGGGDGSVVHTHPATPTDLDAGLRESCAWARRQGLL